MKQLYGNSQDDINTKYDQHIKGFGVWVTSDSELGFLQEGPSGIRSLRISDFAMSRHVGFLFSAFGDKDTGKSS